MEIRTQETVKLFPEMFRFTIRMLVNAKNKEG